MGFNSGFKGLNSQTNKIIKYKLDDCVEKEQNHEVRNAADI